jgi:hypothetical protein
VVEVVWESLDYECAERLTPQLLGTARHLAQFGELERVGVVLTPQLEEQLANVSRPTVQRFFTKLARLGRRHCVLPRRGPQAANRANANSATKGVPMGRIPWDIQEAGHFEVDLVHHCGESTQGEYVHTLQMVDALTGWRTKDGMRGWRCLVRGRQPCRRGSGAYRRGCHSPSRSCTPTMGLSSSMTRWCASGERSLQDYAYPGPVLTTRTTTGGWSRRTTRF